MARLAVGIVVCLALTGLTGVAPPGAAAQELNFQYRRLASVEAPGWQAVPADPAMLGAARQGALRIYDPQDRELPFVLTSPASVSRELAVEVEDVVPAQEGWHIVLDLGPAPPAHNRLEVGLAEAGVVGAVEVAGSDDLDTWQPLGTGRVFRLGPGAELEGTEVRYAPTSARYLRVTWPTEDSPQVTRIQARAAEPSASTQVVEVQLDNQASRPGSATYDLVLPADDLPVRTVVVHLERPASAGVRLFVPRAGIWNLIWEGVVETDTNGAGRIELGDWNPDSPRLRLAVHAGGDIDVAVAGAHLEVVPHWLVFEASSTGEHAIAYGSFGVAPPDYPALQFPEPVQSLPVPELGEPIRLDQPGIPESLSRLGPVIDRSAFRLVLPLSAADAEAGALVAATLPPDAYASAVSSRLTDLRVLVADGQVPYVWRRPPEPELVTEAETEPQESDAGRSRITVDLGHSQLPLTTLELTAPAAPFVRPIEARFVPEEAAGAEAPQRAGQAQWRCPGFAPLPCRFTLDLPPNRHPHMELVFDDGDNPPLPEVVVRVWRVTDEVRFPWPDDSPVLAVGNPEIGPPRYDLEQVADEVRARPAVPASVGDAAAPEPRVDLGRPAFLMAMALGALALLLVLVRALRGTGGETTEP